MRENYLSDLIAAAIINKSTALAITSYKKLEEPDSFRVVTDALKNHKNGFTSFLMTYSTLPAGGAEKLASALTQEGNNIHTLDFSNTTLGIEEVDTLAKAFVRPHSRVAFLNLANGSMGSYATQSIATALRNPFNKIKYLNLSYSMVGHKGAKHLAEALANQNCRLVYLNLDEHSTFCQNGYKEIGESLRSNFYLLCLSNAPQAAVYIKRNQEFFKNNCRSVLSGNSLTELGRAMVLTQCETLLRIDPVIEGVTKEDMQAVVAKLRERAGVKPLLNSINSIQKQGHLASAASVSLTGDVNKLSVTYDAAPSWQQQTEKAKTEGEVVQQVI